MPEPTRTTFETSILVDGNNTGIEVPPAIVDALGKGKRPPVLVDVDGYTYRSTVSTMGGRHLIPFAKEHRDASGIKGGDQVTVSLTLDEQPRTVELPEQLRVALVDHGKLDAFEALSYTNRKEACRSVAEAKTEDTRARRIAKVVDAL